ncbi:hypothetical protein VE23_05945 [Paenibacillus sp. D9]|uniref:hypothetical protein n=1 Tax=Paenibacillus sp. D9 TaxID=665792 RepID=UPI00061FC0BB|nr:hypothetical protein [Paenibacillus sp. D9]KKC46783.1 hypothetical protein VE23_05945 [Paenibacillus sp. D9]
MSKYSIHILDQEEREFVGSFFAERPHLDTSLFLRACILDGIRTVHDRELEKAIERVNKHQRQYGGQQV